MRKILIVAFIIFCVCPAFADERGLLEIQSIPQLDGTPENMETLIGVWDGKGVIASVYSDRLVISDSNFYMAQNVVFITTKGTPYKKSVIPGMAVYYFLDSEKKVIKLAINTEE